MTNKAEQSGLRSFERIACMPVDVQNMGCEIIIRAATWVRYLWVKAYALPSYMKKAPARSDADAFLFCIELTPAENAP